MYNEGWKTYPVIRVLLQHRKEEQHDFLEKSQMSCIDTKYRCRRELAFVDEAQECSIAAYAEKNINII